MSRQPQEPRPGRPERPALGGPEQNWRWLVLVLLLLVVAAIVLPPLFSKGSRTQLSYTQFLGDVNAKTVKTADVSNDSGVITGQLNDGTQYQVNGPQPAIANDVATMRANGVALNFHTQGSNILGSILSYSIPFLLLIGVLV